MALNCSPGNSPFSIVWIYSKHFYLQFFLSRLCVNSSFSDSIIIWHLFSPFFYTVRRWQSLKNILSLLILPIHVNYAEKIEMNKPFSLISPILFAVAYVHRLICCPKVLCPSPYSRQSWQASEFHTSAPRTQCCIWNEKKWKKKT